MGTLCDLIDVMAPFNGSRAHLDVLTRSTFPNGWTCHRRRMKNVETLKEISGRQESVFKSITEISGSGVKFARRERCVLPICLPSIIRFWETDFSNRSEVQSLDIKTRAALSRECIFSARKRQNITEEDSKRDVSQRACCAHVQF